MVVKSMRIYSSTCSLAALLAVSLLSLAAANDVLAARHLALLHPATLVRALDALRRGRRARKEKSKEHADDPDDPLRHLRRVQEDGGQPATCEAALAEAEQNLAAYEEKEKLEKEEGPNYLFVQLADQCIFQTTDSGNLVLKSRHFHGDTVKFSDRPFTYEEEISTESFFDSFDDTFNAGNGGKPNAAITLVQNDESKDVVVSVIVKAVVKHRDDPNGPTYVYKLEQSDEQDSVTSLSDVMGGKDKMTYDHCSIFIDADNPGCVPFFGGPACCPGICGPCNNARECYCPKFCGPNCGGGCPGGDGSIPCCMNAGAVGYGCAPCY